MFDRTVKFVLAITVFFGILAFEMGWFFSAIILFFLTAILAGLDGLSGIEGSSGSYGGFDSNWGGDGGCDGGGD